MGKTPRSLIAGISLIILGGCATYQIPFFPQPKEERELNEAYSLVHKLANDKHEGWTKGYSNDLAVFSSVPLQDYSEDSIGFTEGSQVGLKSNSVMDITFKIKKNPTNAFVGMFGKFSDKPNFSLIFYNPEKLKRDNPSDGAILSGFAWGYDNSNTPTRTKIELNYKSFRERKVTKKEVERWTKELKTDFERNYK